MSNDIEGVFKEGSLKPGDWLYSKNGQYRMGFNNQGQLVVQNTFRADENGNPQELYTVSDKKGTELQYDDGWWWGDSGGIQLLNGDDAVWEGWEEEDSAVVMTNDGRFVLLTSPPPDDWNGEYSSLDSDKIKDQKGKPDQEGEEGDLARRHTGNFLKDYKLTINPPPHATQKFKDFCKVHNEQVQHLAYNLGSGSTEVPKVFGDDKDKPDNLKHMDDNLDPSFISAITKNDGWGVGRSEVEAAHMSAITKLGTLGMQWETMDAKFQEQTAHLKVENNNTFKRMHETIWDLNEQLFAKSKEVTAVSGSEYNQTDKIGIQHPNEELPMYRLVRNAVQSCIEIVAAYADTARKLGLATDLMPDPSTNGDTPLSGDTPHSGDKPPKDDQKHKPVDKKPVTDQSQTDPYADQSQTDPYANRNPGTQQADVPDMKPLFDDLGFDSSGAPTGVTGVGNGDTSSSGDFGSRPGPLTDGTGRGSGTTTTTATPTPSAPPATPVNAGAGSGMGMDPSALMAMAAMGPMMQGMANRPEAKSHKDKDDDRDRRDDEAGPSAPAPNATAPAATPGAPDATGPAPTVSATPDAGTPPPVQTHPLSDNPTVAEALRKVQENTALDAKAAYAGTAGESTQEHLWVTVTDTSQLNTGDVVQWTNEENTHSALIVKKGNELFFMDNGEPVPLNTDERNSAKYGRFTGFFHPSGLDATPAPSEMPPPIVTQQTPKSPPPPTMPQT